MWEKDVCLLWRTIGRKYPDWEDAQYLQHFCMSKDMFWCLYKHMTSILKGRILD